MLFVHVHDWAIRFVVLILLQAPAVDPQAANTALDSHAIDTYIENKMRWPRIPGLSLAIVKGDKIVYLKSYGEAGPSGRPMTPQTPLIIGSLTKPFTALAVMQLVETGKVDLDAPVQKYIPWFRVADVHASSQITVRQLLYQTSGLPMLREPQLWTAQDPQALERTVRFLADASLNSPPGERFAYANANYETLGLIVQMVSGQSYETYVTEHIFAPLEMKNSFASQDEAIKNGMAQGHRWWYGFPVAKTFPQNRSEFQTSIFFDPDERVGVFVGANVISGLDGFSSPHGSDPLDGVTVRAVAQTVLSLATNRPLPDQGRGKRWSYIVFDLALLTLTGLLVISLVRMRKRFQRLRSRGIAAGSFRWRAVVVGVTHFTLAPLLLYLTLNVIIWRALVVMFEPDLVYWLDTIALVLVVKGIIEITLLFRVLHSHQKAY